MPTISRKEYAALFGPTTGDKIRLGDTDLVVEIEKDLRGYGDESVYGGGKTLRAGMGGDAITDILSAAPWSRAGPLLLLQPMSKAEVLRAWLPLNGYEVFREELVQDKGVLYPILSVRGGGMPPASDAQAWGGFLLDEDPLWGAYIADRLLRLRRAASGLEKARDPALAEKRRRMLNIIDQLEEKKGEWERANAAGH